MAALLKFRVQKQLRITTATWEVWTKPICIADCMELPANQKNGGLIDRSICNAFVVHKKLKDKNCTLLNFRRSVSQSLITLGKPPKVGRPLSTPSNQLTVSKRRKSNYSTPSSIRTENVGIHWVVHDPKRGRCEVCSKKKVESRPFLKCSACNVYLCIDKKRNCFSKYDT